MDARAVAASGRRLARIHETPVSGRTRQCGVLVTAYVGGGLGGGINRVSVPQGSIADHGKSGQPNETY